MIKVLLAEDHELVRNGIRMMLEAAGGFLVVAEAADGREALQGVQTHAPDLAIVDVGMPNLNGIETTRQIRSTSPTTRILILSMHTDPQYVRAAFGAGRRRLRFEGGCIQGITRGDPTSVGRKDLCKPGAAGFLGR